MLTMMLACAGGLLFFKKGVTNDDLVFLDYARLLHWDPSRCTVVDYPFQGVVLKDFIVFESSHPFAIPYYLKILLRIFGDHTPWLHLGFLPFFALGAWGLGLLLWRYAEASPFWGLAVLLGPFYWPNATSLMTDAPLAAFWWSAMASWELALSRQGRRQWLWLGGTSVLALFTLFTAYQGFGLLILILWRGWQSRQLGKSLICVLMPLLPMVLWLWRIFDGYALIPFLTATRDHLSTQTEMTKGLFLANILAKAAVLPVYLGCAMIPLSIGCWLRLKTTRALATLVGLLGWSLLLSPGEEPPFTTLSTTFALAATLLGLGTVMLIALESGQKSYRNLKGLLWLWLGGFLLFHLLPAPFASVRYLLPALPPLMLLLMGETLHKSQWALGLLLPLQVVIGFAVTRAEYRYAQAQDLRALPLPALEHLQVLGEMGLRHSAPLIGAQAYEPFSEEPLAFLLVPEEIDHIPPPASLATAGQLMQTWTVEDPWPVRVMHSASQAGLYRHTKGPLPFSFSFDPVETFQLYRLLQSALPAWPLTDEPHFETAGPLLAGLEVSQEFVCTANQLCQLKLFLATYARNNHSSLQLVLSKGDQEGIFDSVLATKLVDSHTLSDNQWLVFEFPPIADSKGALLRLSLMSPDADEANAVTIWTDRAAPGFFLRQGNRLPGQLALEAFALGVQP
jgi:hypothetical protein